MSNALTQLQRLVREEDGTAMTSNAGFLAGCALVCALTYYYAGGRIMGWLYMVTQTLPPDGLGSNLR
jgi:hypothetical protein